MSYTYAFQETYLYVKWSEVEWRSRSKLGTYLNENKTDMKAASYFQFPLSGCYLKPAKSTINSHEDESEISNCFSRDIRSNTSLAALFHKYIIQMIRSNKKMILCFRAIQRCLKLFYRTDSKWYFYQQITLVWKV